MTRLVVTLALAACVLAGTAAPLAAQRARTATAAGRVVVANDFPGRDLGERINAADRALGAAAGEIQVRPGGVISTQAVIGSGHRLRFSAGTFRLETQLINAGAILLKSGASVAGAGWETVIVEPPRTGWIVFQSYADAMTNHAGTDSDIAVTDLQIRGANPGVEGGVRQTVQLGNCHRCRVENVWFNGTGVIGVQAGGSPLGGNFADGVTIRKNLFTRVASQAAAVVNGRNVVIDGNTFKDSGRPGANQGMTAIDVEPNDPRDIAQNITITNNLVDSRGSGFLHGNGILVQNSAGTRDFGPVLVERNTVVGGELTPQGGTGNVAIGIYVAGHTQNVRVVNNTVRRVSHSGIRLQLTTRNYVAGNTLVSTGSGGIGAFEVIDTTDSEIVNNVVSVDPNSQAATSVIQEAGTTTARNVYRGNTNGRAPLAPILLRRR